MRDIIEIRQSDHYWFRVNAAWILDAVLAEDAFLLSDSKGFLTNFYKMIERNNEVSGKKKLYMKIMKLDDFKMAAYISYKKILSTNIFSELNPHSTPGDRLIDLQQKGIVIVDSKARATNLIVDYKKAEGIKGRILYEILELKEGRYVLRLK